MFYVYVLYRVKDKKLYIGYTADLRRRFGQHISRQDCKLMYYEAYLLERLARRRELQLKQYGGSWRSLKKRIDINNNKEGGVVF